MVLRDICEGGRAAGVRSEVGFGEAEASGGGSRELGRAGAFLDLAEGVSLDLEILLHLADGRRGRRRRHGLPAATASSAAAGFGEDWTSGTWVGLSFVAGVGLTDFV